MQRIGNSNTAKVKLNVITRKAERALETFEEFDHKFQAAWNACINFNLPHMQPIHSY